MPCKHRAEAYYQRVKRAHVPMGAAAATVKLWDPYLFRNGLTCSDDNTFSMAGEVTAGLAISNGSLPAG